jgi:DNA-binding FrmR family transcriptional regulator
LPVHGQFLWLLMDNFKRIAGYNDRCGVYHVDFETRQRIPKLLASDGLTVAAIRDAAEPDLDTAADNLDNPPTVDLSSRAGQSSEHTYRGILFPCRHKPQGYPLTWPERDRSRAKETDVELPEEVLNDLRKRLRRVAGQVQGIERMLDDGRECRDVVTQISAANRALEQAGFRLVSAGLTYCLAHPEEAEADGYPLDEVEKMFMRLA